MTWTKDRPTESGFYWYREKGDLVEVVEWDLEFQCIQVVGCDVPWGDDFGCKIEGEFWPERLEVPE